MIKLWYLYSITNLINGKMYVGITTNPIQRWRNHKSSNKWPIAKAIKKYGKENFEFRIWYCGPEFKIKIMECQFIKLLGTKVPNGYNITDGGDGTSGHIVSEETRKKWSNQRKGLNNRKNTPQTEEERKRIGDLNRGRKLSEDMKHRIYLANKGSKRNADTKQKMSLSRQGGKSSSACPIMCNFVKYTCIKEAARLLDINYSTLRDRIRRYGLTGNWPPGCGYLAKQTT